MPCVSHDTGELIRELCLWVPCYHIPTNFHHAQRVAIPTSTWTLYCLLTTKQLIYTYSTGVLCHHHQQSFAFASSKGHHNTESSIIYHLSLRSNISRHKALKRRAYHHQKVHHVCALFIKRFTSCKINKMKTRSAFCSTSQVSSQFHTGSGNVNYDIHDIFQGTILYQSGSKGVGGTANT